MSTEENATPKPPPPLYKTIEVVWSKLAETLNTEAEAGYHVAHDLVRSVHDPNAFQILLHQVEDTVRDKAMALVSQLVDAAPAYLENLLAGLPPIASAASATEGLPAEDRPADATAEAPASAAP